MRVHFGIVLCCFAFWTEPAPAQWAPDATARIVVPFAAGGPGDILMRILAEHITGKTAQKIIVEIATYRRGQHHRHGGGPRDRRRTRDDIAARRKFISYQCQISKSSSCLTIL